MARYPFNLDDLPDSEYAAELRKPATTLPFPPAMDQDYLDDHLRRTEPRIRVWTAVAMFGIAARYGGEEFAIIVYDVSALAVDDIAEELRQAIENLNIVNADSACSDYVTVSIGVAVVQPALGRTPKGAMQLADEALYRSKAAGRNRCSIVGQAEYETLVTGSYRKPGTAKQEA